MKRHFERQADYCTAFGAELTAQAAAPAARLYLSKQRARSAHRPLAR
jgi:hypothetical protein